MSKHTITSEKERIINEFLIRINYSNATDIYVGTQKHTKQEICTFSSINLEVLQSLLINDSSSPYYQDYLTYSVDENDAKEVKALKDELAVRSFYVTDKVFKCATDIKDEKADFSDKWIKYLAVVNEKGDYDTRILF